MPGFDRVGIYRCFAGNVVGADDGIAGVGSGADWRNYVSYRVVNHWLCFVCRDHRPDHAQQGLKSFRRQASIIGTRPVRWRSRYLIVHNIGAGTRIEDVLFAWTIEGHYRFF